MVDAPMEDGWRALIQTHVGWYELIYIPRFRLCCWFTLANNHAITYLSSLTSTPISAHVVCVLLFLWIYIRNTREQVWKQTWMYIYIYTFYGNIVMRCDCGLWICLSRPIRGAIGSNPITALQPRATGAVVAHYLYVHICKLLENRQEIWLTFNISILEYTRMCRNFEALGDYIYASSSYQIFRVSLLIERFKIDML